MAKRIAKPKDRFFVRELEGEEPLSRSTAEALLHTTYAVVAMSPWEHMEESDLVFVHHPDSSEPDVCSVTGSAFGQYGITVYLGLEGYRFFRSLVKARQITPTLFFENNSSLRMAFEEVSELKDLDRELLRETGFLNKAGRYAVRFESYRPGHVGWYVSQAEAARMDWSMIAMHALMTAVKQNPGADLWALEGVYPTVTIRRNDKGFDIQVRPALAPSLPRVRDKTPGLDSIDIASLAGLKVHQDFVLQCAFYLLPIPIGEEHQRKMCFRLAMVADAASGFVFKPCLERPDVPAVKMLVDQTVNAIRFTGALPSEIQVSEKRFALALASLKKEFGIRIKVAQRLPAVEDAVEAMKSSL